MLSQIVFLTFAISLFSVEQTFEDMRFYPNPGIVANREGRWVGSDHLYNLTNKIDIVVEFFTPPNMVLPITRDAVKTTISEIFAKARITPPTESLGAPLPFFHMLIMVYPIDKGFVAYCEGRLFERVELDRVRADPQTTMQAITWESQNLIISSKDDLVNQVTKSVDEIATSFAERYRFYEDIRFELQRNKNQ